MVDIGLLILPSLIKGRGREEGGEGREEGRGRGGRGEEVEK